MYRGVSSRGIVSQYMYTQFKDKLHHRYISISFCHYISYVFNQVTKYFLYHPLLRCHSSLWCNSPYKQPSLLIKVDNFVDLYVYNLTWCEDILNIQNGTQHRKCEITCMCRTNCKSVKVEYHLYYWLFCNFQ